MKKILAAMLTAAVGAMFPAAFLLVLVGAMHIFDGNTESFMSIAIAFLVVAWLFYRKLDCNE